jgi:hypothetical protein
MSTTKTKNLGSFKGQHPTLCELDGGKSLMQVETPRKVEVWLVYPATGNNDHKCLLVDRRQVSKLYRTQTKLNQKESVLRQYCDRVKTIY